MPRFRIAFMMVVIAALLAAAGAPVLVRAQESAPGVSSEQARQDEAEAAWRAGAQAGTQGPADIPLLDQAVLKLPAGYFFIPKAEGTRILRALGNAVGDQTFVGLIAGTHPDDPPTIPPPIAWSGRCSRSTRARRIPPAGASTTTHTRSVAMAISASIC
jgi:uncharacterized membrane-anchored protein